MARNFEKDYKEIAKFATDFKGKTALECIEAYAAKRKIVSHRAGRAFWDKVDLKEIAVSYKQGVAYIN